MDLFLSPHIFLAARAEDLVILDISRGEYLLAPGGGLGLEVENGSNLVQGASPILADALAAIGGLAADGARVLRGAPPAPPRCDLTGLPETRPTSEHFRLWSLAGVDMVRGYWRKPFAKIIAAERAAPTFPPDPERLVACALAFRQLLPFVPFQGVCLFRSLMQRAFLRRAGLSATWVIGCRTWPFEAHCWLQAGDLVLDDTADHVTSFTPVLALPG